MILNKKKSVYFLIFLNLPIVIISFIYNFFFEGGFIVECVFQKTFGLYCPGCGGSRALNALLRFDFPESFIYYPPIILCALLILITDLQLAVFLIKKDKKYIKINGKIFLIIPPAIILNFIIKNLLLFFGIRFF